MLGHTTAQQVKKFVQDGLLKRVDGEAGRVGLYIPKDSLCTFITDTKRVPEWVDAAKWVEECLASTDPYVNAQDAATFLWVERNDLMALLIKKRAWFIASGQRNVRVSRKWLDRQLGYNRFSARKIADMFSVTEQEVWDWQNKGLIVCPLEVHRHLGPTSFLWEPCWGAILTANTCPQTKKVTHFFASRRHELSPSVLWDAARASAKLNSDATMVEKMAQSGELHSLLTPAGDRRFNPEDIRFHAEHQEG